MSYNLEKELIAVRNLSEGLLGILQVLCAKGKHTECSVKLEKYRDAYDLHREARFDEEVENAKRVMDKAIKCFGDEPVKSLEFVRYEWFEDVLRMLREAREEIDRLKESLLTGG